MAPAAVSAEAAGDSVHPLAPATLAFHALGTATLIACIDRTRYSFRGQAGTQSTLTRRLLQTRRERARGSRLPCCFCAKGAAVMRDRWQPGRNGLERPPRRSRKPLTAARSSEGSNPSPSAESAKKSPLCSGFLGGARARKMMPRAVSEPSHRARSAFRALTGSRHDRTTIARARSSCAYGHLKKRGRVPRAPA